MLTGDLAGASNHIIVAVAALLAICLGGRIHAAPLLMLIILRDRAVVDQIVSPILVLRVIIRARMMTTRCSSARIRQARLLLLQTNAQSVFATLQLHLLHALLLDNHVGTVVQADAPARYVILLLQRSVA